MTRLTIARNALCCLTRIAIVAILVVLTATADSRSVADDGVSKPFNVLDFGAQANDQGLDTSPIQNAIDACHNAGGGRVLLPEGGYLSGTIRLRDGVELHLAKSARLGGTTDLDAYSGFDADTWGKSRWNRGLIVGEGLSDIAITGEGVIDGNKVFDPSGEEKMRGPHTVLLSDCQNVTLRGITFLDAANYAFMFYGSENVLVERVIFEGGWDGVHFRGKPDRWNRNVRIEDCKFYTGDDCIAGHYIQDAVVEDCIINSSCNGVRLIGPAKSLTFASCEFFGPGKFEHRTSRNLHRTNMLAALLIQPSAWTPTPGPVKDLLIQDVVIRNVACPFHVSLREGNTGDRVTVERLKAAQVYGPAISVESWAEEPLGEVTLRDIDVEYTPDAIIDPRLDAKPKIQSPIRKPGVGVFARKLPAWGFYARDVRKVHLDRVRLVNRDEDDARPVVRIDDVENLMLDHVQHSAIPQGTRPFVLNDVKNVERNESKDTPKPPEM